MIVIACEGKVSCANRGPAATSAVVPTTKLRRSIMFPPESRRNRRHSVLLALNAADRMHRRFNPLGVLVPEFRECCLIEIGDLVADIVDGGFELLAR